LGATISLGSPYANSRSFGGAVKRTAVIVVISLAAAIALSGCGMTSADDGKPHSSHSSGDDMTRNNKGTTRKGG